MTSKEAIDRLNLMFEGQGLPAYEAGIINDATVAGAPYLDLREACAIFWARLDEHEGHA